ncbi:basic blue protein-like [Aristolochia californica]|uniref:basic blue protein-like n=1 Tax=Aristolochia californica TaxID=171875 RepID=UPI0035DFD0BA
MTTCLMVRVVVVVVVAVLMSQGRRCEAQAHHVVGGDRGWEPASNIGEWSAGRVFRVGDKIWFTFSGALDNVIELGSREELESCDLSNPIRLYSDGLLQLDLDREGMRYFTSGGRERCKKGLKLDVNVLPRAAETAERSHALAASDKPNHDHAMAAGPTPSASAPLKAIRFVFLLALPVVSAMGL